MEENSQAITQPSTPQQTLGIPTSWPGAWGAYKYSKQAVMLNIGTVLLLILINIVSGFLGIIPVLGTIASYVLAVVLSVATAKVLLAGVEGSKMSLGESFSYAFAVRSVKYFLNMILLIFILIGSLLLFIVPFFFIFPRVCLAPYFVALDDMGPIEAIKASWEATKGHVGKVYGMVGVAIVFAILCIVLIGIYFSIMYSAVTVLFYVFLKKQMGGVSAKPSVVPAEAPVAPSVPVSPETPAVDSTPQVPTTTPQPVQPETPQVTSPEQTPPTNPVS